MAICTHHSNCPKCGSRDNRAIYDDGSEWCFGCGYYVPPRLSGFVKAAKQIETEEKTWTLPDDLTQDFPQEVVTYASKSGITVPELIEYNFFYSRRTGRLWRVFDDGEHKLIHSPLRSGCSAAEARQLHRAAKAHGANGPKSLFFGQKEDTTPIAGTQRPCGHLVLTEDSLSSIKVGRVVHGLPLFGTSITMTKLVKLARVYQKITVWLDRDKFKEAWEIALKLKWINVEVNVVLTPLDPKCYNEIEIKELINGH